MTQVEYDSMVEIYTQGAKARITQDFDMMYTTIAFVCDGTGIPEPVRLWRQAILDQMEYDISQIPPVDE